MTQTHKILFVDTDTRVLESQRRLIRTMRPSWQAMYADSGPDAMTDLRLFEPEIIVTELNIPVQPGTDLIKFVQGQYPDILRIVLSSESDSQAETVLRATQSAHRFLVKPCKSEELINNIEQAIKLRKIIYSQELRTIVSGIPYLPSLPNLYRELVTAIESPGSSLQEIGDIIARDVSMTTRILHLVNSAFFGLPRRVANPQDAAVMLGINVLKSLVLYVKLFFAAPDSNMAGLSLDEIWEHSSLTARFAKSIVIQLKYDQKIQEEAFLAGMLHDIGKIMLLDHPRYFQRVETELDENPGLTFADAEYSLFSGSHAEVGGYLLGLWGMSDSVVEAVACHHRPSQLGGELSPVVVSTHVANVLLSRAAGFETSFDKDVISEPQIKTMLPVFQNQAKELYEKSKR